MTLTRGQIIGGIIALVLVIGGVYAVWYFKAGEGRYAGLQTMMEVEMDEATRTYLTQRLKTTEAAVEAAKKKGDEVDLNLYLSIASDAYTLGDLVTAREALEVQLNENPAHYGAWNTYGTVLEAMGDYDGAREAYQKAITLGAKVEEFYRDYVTLIQNHFPAERGEILRVLELSLAEKGQTSWNMVELGRYYVSEGQCQKGFEHYSVAVSLAPANEEIKNELAEARKSCK